MPYGPPYDPEGPDDGEPHGLLGNFLSADLGAQFEALQNDWINLGFQDPRITGTNDPLVGNHDPLEAPFRFVPDPDDPDEVVELAVPQLVRTVGGAYTFLPSVAGLAWLARETDGPPPATLSLSQALTRSRAVCTMYMASVSYMNHPDCSKLYGGAPG